MEKTKHLFVYISHKKIQVYKLTYPPPIRPFRMYLIQNIEYYHIKYMLTLTMIAKIKLVASFNPNAIFFLIYRVGFFLSKQA